MQKQTKAQQLTELLQEVAHLRKTDILSVLAFADKLVSGGEGDSDGK